MLCGKDNNKMFLQGVFTWGNEFGRECEDEFVWIWVDEFVCFFEWIQRVK